MYPHKKHVKDSLMAALDAWRAGQASIEGAAQEHLAATAKAKEDAAKGNDDIKAKSDTD